MIRLQEKYKKEVVPAMMEKFGYKSPMTVPKIEKVVINTGIGKILGGVDPSKRENVIKNISSDIGNICGQKTVLTKAKKAISAFKTREGDIIGVKATLRRGRMYDFLGRLIDFALPRSRDFQGISSESVDKKGNLTIGIREHIVFPEIQPEKSKIIFGLEVTVVTNAENKGEAIEMFRLLGFPIRH